MLRLSLLDAPTHQFSPSLADLRTDCGTISVVLRGDKPQYSTVYLPTVHLNSVIESLVI
jgi:hypothetical protein